MNRRIILCTLLTLTLTCGAYTPTRYEEFLTKKIDALKTQQASIATKLKGMVQGSRSSLLSTQDYLDRTLKAVVREKEHLKNLNIKDAREENFLVRKTQLRYSINELEQQLREIKQNELFFENQTDAKNSQAELKQKWKNKRDELTRKLERQRSDLENLK